MGLGLHCAIPTSFDQLHDGLLLDLRVIVVADNDQSLLESTYRCTNAIKMAHIVTGFKTYN